MDIRAGSPPEPEETERDGEGADERGREPPFGLQLALGVELWLDVPALVVDEGREDDEDADEDADEGRALEAQAEAVDLREDDGEALEPDVQQSVDERDVQVEQEDHGLGEAQGERAHQHHLRHLTARHVLALELRLADQFVVAAELAQAPRAPVQDVGRRRLGHAQRQQHQREARQPHQLPDRPAPAARLDCEPAHQRAQNRPAHRPDAPNRHPVRALRRRVDVADGRAASRERRRAHEPRDEAEREEHAEVRRQRRRDLQHHKQRQRPDVDRPAPDLRHLRQGRPQHGTHAVAEHEERQPQCRRDSADAECLADV